MSIITDPSWTFEQALEAAWREYPSPGMQFGITNRIRFLVQWANVVGGDRATREFEDAEQRGLVKEFSDYARRKLRKTFRGMPRLAPRESPHDLRGILRWIAAQSFENETGFLAKAVPPFARAVGWNDDQLFFQMRLPGEEGKYADAVLATRTHPVLAARRDRTC